MNSQQELQSPELMDDKSFLKAILKDRLNEALKEMEPGDEKIIQEAKDVFLSQDQKKKIQFSQSKLCDIENHFSPQTVIRLSLNCPEFAMLCNDESLPHQAAWSHYLKERNYVGVNIVSIDSHVYYTVYQQYISKHIYDMYLDLKESEAPTSSVDAKIKKLQQEVLLDYACEMKVVYALMERINLDAENLIAEIKESNNEIKEETPAKLQLKQDEKLLCNLYWSLGYVFMSRVYNHIGNSLENAENILPDLNSDDDFKDQDSQEHIILKQSDVYQLRAYECFLCAKEIEAYQLKQEASIEMVAVPIPPDGLSNAQSNKMRILLSDSQNIIDAVCKEQGLAFFGANDWEQGERFYKEGLKPFLRLPSILKLVQNDIQAEMNQAINSHLNLTPRSRIFSKKA